MTPRTTDANQSAIVAALREMGATVVDLHRVGHGCPDILVGWRGRNYLFEVKTATGKLNKLQQVFFRDWRGRVAVIRSIDDALEYIRQTEETWEL